MSMTSHPANPIAAVMVHVADVEAALIWYQQAFPQARRARATRTDFEFLMLAGVPLEFVPADDKVASGAAGSVVYWQVAQLNAALRHLQALGATLYRGPMQIEVDLWMCQVQDPWGNCIGLRGPN